MLYRQLRICAKVQLIYALESDSASIGKAFYAIRDMGEQVAAALDNAALRPYAAEVQVYFRSIICLWLSL